MTHSSPSWVALTRVILASLPAPGSLMQKAATSPAAIRGNTRALTSSLPNMARRLNDAGADALVLFNRFFQPDVDIQTESEVAKLALSTEAVSLTPLRWAGLFPVAWTALSRR